MDNSRITLYKFVGFIAFLFMYYIGLISSGIGYRPLYYLIGGAIIYWGWKQIPKEKKDYSFWWDKYTMVKEVK
jgi:hypothetical protein